MQVGSQAHEEEPAVGRSPQQQAHQSLPLQSLELKPWQESALGHVLHP